MKVILRKPVSPDGTNLWSLTVTHEYEVIGIVGDWYQLVDDIGEPLLFDPDSFQILDPLEPEFWVSQFGKAGERYAHPPDWNKLGYFEKWHDGDEATRQDFSQRLKELFPETAARTFTTRLERGEKMGLDQFIG